MPTEDADVAITVPPPGILHMRVENVSPEIADKFHVIDALIAEVARVVVKAEAWVVIDRLECGGRTGNIKGDFSRMHFEREIDILLLEHIENRSPTVGKVFEARFNLTGHGGWK